MDKYNHKKIEAKWQKVWAKSSLYKVDIQNAKNPFYNLWMFPYPSGARMHVGHAYASTGSDIMGRFMRMKGKDVFQPMGFDAFGIHGENYAIKVGEHPQKLMEELCDRFRDEQFKRIGHGYDWSKEVRTYQPKYYKWTQWIFLQLFKNGLAERKEASVNWCPSCKTVLADEQVISGNCERCSSKVEQKVLKQWFFKITKFAPKLLENLDKIDWSKGVVESQRNWIGKSVGTEITFDDIKVFTTRPDTLFGATYLVLSPENPLVDKVTAAENKKLVSDYRIQASKKTNEQRTTFGKDKTGIFTGGYAVNPANNQKIPIWIADYVLMEYGTGAVMGVPAHDQRDGEFAKKYKLPIKRVVEPAEAKRVRPCLRRRADSGLTLIEKAYEGYGILINSSKFTGMSSEKAIPAINKWLEENKCGKYAVKYKLRDWLISRQRYWSAPIPIIYCKKCGIIGVSEKDLPVELPYVKDWKPKGDGRGPLASIPEFVNTTCPKCGGKAQRETDTLDNFLDSGWYFFRYPFADRDDVPFDVKSPAFKKWLPVHLYIGGAEHAVLHLMYTRFLTMAFKEIGLIDFEEPFVKFFAHGIITKGGRKMSKSLGNVVNPDEYIDKVGADAFRLYLMFLGPYDRGGDFDDKGISGVVRFLNRFWKLSLNNSKKSSSKDTLLKLNKTIIRVGSDIKEFKYNTAIAYLMELVNEWETGYLSLNDTKSAIKLLAPFAPFITEELWHILGGKGSIHLQPWPKVVGEMPKDEIISIAVQINGKLKSILKLGKTEARSREVVENKSKELEKLKNVLNNNEVRRVIFVPGKIINFVV